MSSCQAHLLSSDLKTFIIVFCHNNLCDYFTKFRCISSDVLLDFATPRWTFMSETNGILTGALCNSILPIVLLWIKHLRNANK
jgi:hypothetical protein